MRLLWIRKEAAEDPRALAARLEEAVGKLYAAQTDGADPDGWLRATRLRHTALAVAALEVAEAIRELKEEIAELRGHPEIAGRDSG
jgi:hypothetical protein